MELFWILALVSVVYFLYQKGKGTSFGKEPPAYRGARKISSPIPEGYQIYVTDTLVSGVSFRKDEVKKFLSQPNQTLAFEREPCNKHDENAIKVIGTASARKYFLGYVPKEISKQIVSTDMLSCILPRLVRTYQSKSDYIEIHFQIVGPKEKKEKFDSFLKNQPAASSQKEFYKFFNLSIPKNLTVGEAEKFIIEYRKNATPDSSLKLAEFDGYISIIEEFNDKDFRETYEIKKPSRKILEEALLQLKQENKNYQYLSENIEEVVERILKIEPDLTG